MHWSGRGLSVVWELGAWGLRVMMVETGLDDFLGHWWVLGGFRLACGGYLFFLRPRQLGDR